jgi:hypothetical protein
MAGFCSREETGLENKNTFLSSESLYHYFQLKFYIYVKYPSFACKNFSILVPVREYLTTILPINQAFF